MVKPKVKVTTKVFTVMTQQDREATRLMRLQNMLDDLCFAPATTDANKIKSADLLLKCLAAYKEIHEVYMVEPLVVYDDNGQKLMTLSAKTNAPNKPGSVPQ